METEERQSSNEDIQLVSDQESDEGQYAQQYGYMDQNQQQIQLGQSVQVIKQRSQDWFGKSEDEKSEQSFWSSYKQQLQLAQSFQSFEQKSKQHNQQEQHEDEQDEQEIQLIKIIKNDKMKQIIRKFRVIRFLLQQKLVELKYLSSNCSNTKIQWQDLYFNINAHQLLKKLNQDHILGQFSHVTQIAYVGINQEFKLQKKYYVDWKINSKINSSEGLQKCVKKNQLKGKQTDEIKQCIYTKHPSIENLFQFKKKLENQQKTYIKSTIQFLMNSFAPMEVSNRKWVFHAQSIHTFLKEIEPVKYEHLQIYIKYKTNKIEKRICIDFRELKQYTQSKYINQLNFVDHHELKKYKKQKLTYYNQKIEDNMFDIENSPEIYKKYEIGRISFGVFSENNTSSFYEYYSYFRKNDNIKFYYQFIDLLLVRKVGNQYKLEMTSLLNNRVVVKVEVPFTNIKAVYHRKSLLLSQIFIETSAPPKFYINFVQRNLAFDGYYIGQWHRVENFPILKNAYFQTDNYFLFKSARKGTVIRLSVENIEDYSGIMQIFQCFEDYIKINSIEQVKLESYEIIFKSEILWKKFKSLPIFIPKLYENQIPQIKCQLLCLNERNCASALQIIEVLEKIQQFITNRQYQLMNSIRCTIFRLSKIGIQIERKKQPKSTLLSIIEKKMNSQQKGKYGLFSPSQLNADNKWSTITNIKLTPSGLILGQYSHQIKNRVLKQFPNNAKQFLKIHIVDDNGQKIFADYLTGKFFRQLLDNVIIMGKKYYPLSWSQSQLKKSSMWYVRQKCEPDDITVDDILTFLGEFQHINNPALKGARIGQSLSSSYSYDGSLLKVKQIPDIINEKYNFSDGIGKVSESVIQKFAKKLKLKDVSVLQIRYLGAKGLIVAHPFLAKNDIHLRKSMIKFHSHHPDAIKHLDVLGWNRYKVGFINRQIILLLKSCNCSADNFISLQEQYKNQILQAFSSPKCLVSFVRNHLSTNYKSLKESVIDIYQALYYQNTVFNFEDQPFLRGISRKLQAQALQRLRLKARIRVEKSARVIGILDEFGVLNQQEIYCSVIKPETNNSDKTQKPKRFNLRGKVVLTRNPCMYTGDIQIVTCIDDDTIQQRFNQLGFQENYFKKHSNCVIFPQKGSVPLTSKISGSDLDGDQFFISWQKRLMPKYQSPDLIAEDEMIKTVVEYKRCGTKEMLDFFVQFINNQKLGRLANSHLIHGQRNKTTDIKECLMLNRLHNLAVDYPKKGYKFEIPSDLLSNEYPHFLEKPYPYKSYTSTSILGVLYDQIKKIQIEYLRQIRYFRINRIKNFTFQQQQFKKAQQIIQKYKDKILLAMQFSNVKNQFELYCGKQDDKDDNRTIEYLNKLKEEFYEEFLDQRQSFSNNLAKHRSKAMKIIMKKLTFKYLKNKKEDETQKLLVPEIYVKKALLWYLLSITNTKFIQLNERQKLEFTISTSKAGIGLVWLCIPNLMAIARQLITNYYASKRWAPLKQIHNSSLKAYARHYQCSIDGRVCEQK